MLTSPTGGLSRILTAAGRVGRDRWVQVLLVGAVLLLLIDPALLGRLDRLVEWKTVGAITGLLALAKTLEMSDYLAIWSRHILYHCHTERRLGIALILISALLSAWVTNDVALFIVVPLTLSAARLSPLPVAKLVTFEALAVNAGSSLTAIGNPQNLFLWHASGDSLPAFSWRMAPASLLMMLIVLGLAWIALRKAPLDIVERPDPEERSPMLILGGSILYGVFLLALQADQTLLGVIIVLVAVSALSFVTGRRILSVMDWGLVIAFMLMFVDFRGLADLPMVAQGLRHLPLDTTQGAFWTAALGSQLISNVPATITLAKFTHHWSALAFGANAGGFGLAIGSLANLIALRQGARAGLLGLFHRYSIIAWLLATTGCALLLYFTHL